MDNVNSQQNTNMEFIKDMVDLEQELISKFNLSNSTPISKVSELFNYENQKEKIQQVLLHEQLNSYLFSNTILKKDM
jgi:hypothetical protein